MPWNETTRAEYKRPSSRYETDLTDAEWSLLDPHLPGPASTGRPRTTDLREVLNAILYMASTGCQWRALPKDFPPFTTVQNYFYGWSKGGRMEVILRSLRRAARLDAGRAEEPTAGAIDSQSARTTESGGTARIRRRQEGEGPQAPPCGGYGREPADGSDSCGKHSGSGRRTGPVGRGGRVLPDIAGVVRGWGLLGPETCGVPARPQPGSESHSSFPSPPETRVLRFSPAAGWWNGLLPG